MPQGPRPSSSTDDQRNVTVIHDARGHETTITYDAKNNPVTITDADGNAYTKTYNAFSQLTKATRPSGDEQDFYYNSDHDLEQVSVVGDPTKKITIAQDPFGNQTVLLDPDGKHTYSYYSATNQLIRRVNPAGDTETWEYDGRDRLLRRVDAKGRSTRFTYDGNDNLVEVTDALGNVTTRTYDGEDRLLTTTDPLGHTTSYAYDALGRRISETDPLGHAKHYEFDAAGDVTAIDDAKGVRIMTAEYSVRNEATKISNPYGHAIASTYDENGNLVQAVDPLGRRILRDYDDQDRLASTTDPLNRVARKHYDVDSLVRQTDQPGSGPRLYYYTAHGRMSEVWYGELADSPRIITYEYNDWRSRPTTVWDGNRQINSTYDSLGRLAQRQLLINGASKSSRSYTYDEVGNLTTTAESIGGGTITREYDGLDRVTRFVDMGGHELLYDYDAAGRMMRLTYPDGKHVDYTYDAASRLTQVVDWGQRTTQFAYDENDQVTRIDFPNGCYRTLVYDRAHRISRRQDFDRKGGLIVGYQYEYDAAGQLTSVEHLADANSYVPAAVAIAFNSKNFALTFASTSLAPDAEGAAGVVPTGTSSLSALSPADHFLNATYDDEHRLASLGSSTFTYDLEDRLVASTAQGESWTYVVNPHAGFSQVLERIAADGTSTRYVYGLGLLYDVTGSEVQVYHYDARGDTVALTNAAGQVTTRYAYGPFGEEIDPTVRPATPFRFQGLFGVLTDQSGLCYLRFRFYSPALRRFISQDVNPGDIADANSLNLFSYAQDNPIAFNDPNGEIVNILFGAVLGASVGAGSELIAAAIEHRRVDWKSVAASAIGGAVEGAIIFSGVGFVAPYLGGAAGSATASIFDQGFHRGFDSIDWGEVGTSAAIGGALGVFGGGIAAKRVTKTIFKDAAEEAAERVARRTARFWVKHFAIGITEKLPGKTLGVLNDDGYFNGYIQDVADLAQGSFQTIRGFSAGGRVGHDTISHDRYEPLREYVTYGLGERKGPYLHFRDFRDLLRLAVVPGPNAPNFGMAGF